jgi:pyrroline-5-carboxylate reductase
MLAVKPQSFPDVSASLDTVGDGALIISIMAGLSTDRIRAALGGRGRCMRVMPNIACQVGAGMSAIALGAGARSGDEGLAIRLFSALGRTVMVEESLLHAVTAVSGSGPAYVFLLAEAMKRAAVAVGLEDATSEALVRQTIIGAAKLLESGARSPVQWRETVTSRGGTTEAALQSLAQAGFIAAMEIAIRAARDRGSQLERSAD